MQLLHGHSPTTALHYKAIFDPAYLLAPIPQIKQRVKQMIDAFGTQHYIANLGHGITPDVPVDHAKAFVGWQ
jgi:Uroporphyrinogen-III decarboxylase